MEEFRLDESRGDAFTQIADNVPANPERSDAYRELRHLRSALSDRDRQVAAHALIAIAEKLRLDRLASVARNSTEYEFGTRRV